MPDVFEISSMTDAIQGYLVAKKQRNVFEMEKKQREAEIMLNTMQEKRLREQMLQTGKFQQEELGERGQQFQQTYGQREKEFQQQMEFQKGQQQFYETQSSAINKMQLDIDEIKRKYLEDVTPGIITREQKENIFNEKLAEFKASPEEWKRFIDERVADSAAKVAQADLTTKTAEAGIGLVDKQKEAALAEFDRKLKESELNLEWMIKSGTTEDIERIKVNQEQLKLFGEQIKNQTTELGIKQQQLNLATWEFEEAKKNPRISPRELFEFEKNKLNLTVQLDLLELSTRLKESNIPPAISTQLSELFQDQMLKIGQNAPTEEVNKITEQAKQLGSMYGITVTPGIYTKVRRLRFDKDYTIIAGMSTKNVSLITNDQVQELISNIKKSAGITDTITPTPEELEKIRQEREKILGGTGGDTTTTTQPPSLVTNDEQTARGLIDLAISMGLDPLKSVEESTASPAVKAKARELLKNRLQSVK